LKGKPIGKFLVRIDQQKEGAFVLARVGLAKKPIAAVASAASPSSTTTSSSSTLASAAAAAARDVIPSMAPTSTASSAASSTGSASSTSAATLPTPTPSTASTTSSGAGRADKPVVLNKSIVRCNDGRFMIGKRTYPTLVELVSDVAQRRNLKPKKCERYTNLRESFFSVDDNDDLLSSSAAQ
jgi:hypothetical protein